jgi:hypothetical protein
MLCEQGDMGLWNQPLNDKDQKVYKESINKEKGIKNSAVLHENKNKR